MGIGTFLGGIGAGLNGWADGTRQANADNKQQAQDAQDAKIRDANTSQIQSKLELSNKLIANQTAEAENAAELAPTRQKTAKVLAEGEAELAPGKVKLAKGAQDAAISSEIYQKAAAVKAGVMTEDDAHDYVLGRIGEALTNGDTDSATRIMNSAMDAPNLFPQTNGKSKVVKTELVDAPEGATNSAGQPVTGRAVRTTTEDGKLNYLSPDSLAAPYQKLLAQRSMANRVTLKQGDVIKDGITGKTIAENDNGFYKDENGNMVKVSGKMGPNGQLLAGGTGGAGTGANGKPLPPGKTELDIAVKEAIPKDAPYADKVGEIYLNAERIANSGLQVTAKQAAAMAIDIAANPASVKIKVGRDSGTLDSIYSSKQLSGGKGITLAQNVASLDDLKNTDIKTLIPQIQESFATKFPDAAQRTVIQQAAQDPAAAQSFVNDVATKFGPDAGADLAKRLPLIKLLGSGKESAPAAKAPAESQGSGIRKVGGIGTPSEDPTSPAGRAQARRAAAQAESDKKVAEKAAQVAELSKQFNADLATMDPIDLARKYQDSQFSLPTKDVAALRSKEKLIR